MNFKPEMKSKEQLAAEQPTYELVTKYMVRASDLITFKPDQSIERGHRYYHCQRHIGSTRA